MKINKLYAKSISYGGKRSLSSITTEFWHYTGVKGDTAQNEAKYFRYSNARSAGAHFFIDRKGEIYCSIPLNRVAWAVGGSKYGNCAKTGGGKFYGATSNATSVSIELCDCVDKLPSDAQLKAAKWLHEYINSKCPNIKHVLRHFDRTGKDCPHMYCNGGYDDNDWKHFKAYLTGSKVAKPKTSNIKASAYTGSFPTLPKRGYFKKGDSGDNVKKLQKFLNWYNSRDIAVDGVIGGNTIDAVTRFQKGVKLKADGLFGKDCLAKAKKAKR